MSDLTAVTEYILLPPFATTIYFGNLRILVPVTPVYHLYTKLFSRLPF